VVCCYGSYAPLCVPKKVVAVIRTLREQGDMLNSDAHAVRVGNAEVNHSPVRKAVSNHRCEITGVKFGAGLLKH
jgi:hypothetical protein